MIPAHFGASEPIFCREADSIILIDPLGLASFKRPPRLVSDCLCQYYDKMAKIQPAKGLNRDPRLSAIAKFLVCDFFRWTCAGSSERIRHQHH